MAGVAYGATVSIALDEDELLGVHLLARIEDVPDEDTAGFAGVLRSTLRRGLAERLTAAGMEWPPTAQTLDVVETVAGSVTETPEAVPSEESGGDMLRAVVIGAIALAAIVVIIGGYALNWGWTGFASNHQLWDWMRLLLLPVAFGTFGLWLRYSEYVSPARRRAMGVAVLAFAVLVIVGYTDPLTWTGFRGQTLWDWLVLILLPITLVTIEAWPKSGRDVRRWHVVVVVVVVTGFVVTIIGGYAANWKWTGYKGNTLWDWLLLVLAPLAVGTILAPSLTKLLTGRADERAAEEEAREAREQALGAARQRIDDRLDRPRR
jgi:hypothetical protein